MKKHLLPVLFLTLLLPVLAICQEKPGHFLSEVPLYEKARFVMETEKGTEGVIAYLRIYSTPDSADAVVAWYEKKLPHAKKSSGVRKSGTPWVKFDLQPPGAKALPKKVRKHTREFVQIQIEKDASDGSTSIMLTEFVKAQ